MARFPVNRNLLFLIDQFEEIFSEENSDNKDELIRFVRIITDFTRDTPERAYMVHHHAFGLYRRLHCLSTVSRR